MNETPVLIDTPIGPLGAAISRPEGEPVAAALIIPGGGRRTGPNRVWGRMAWALADAGVLTARIDLPGHGDSDLIAQGVREDFEATKYATRWFSELTKNLNLLVVGGCYGSRLVRSAVAEPRVAAVGLVAPYLRVRYPELPTPSRRPAQSSSASRLHAPRSLRRALGWMRRKRPSTLDKDMAEWMVEAGRRTPMWLLVGEKDVAARYVPAIRAMAGSDSSLNIEVIGGLAIHTHTTPDSQQESIARVVKWAHSQIGKLETTAR